MIAHIVFISIYILLTLLLVWMFEGLEGKGSGSIGVALLGLVAYVCGIVINSIVYIIWFSQLTIIIIIFLIMLLIFSLLKRWL